MTRTFHPKIDDWLFACLIVYGIITFVLFISLLWSSVIKAPKKDGTPSPKEDDDPKDFAFYVAIILAIPLWPAILVLGIVIGIPVAIIRKFLCTPGYACCGMSCAKGRKPVAPKVRSPENTAEAGLAAPTPAEAMEMRPMATRSGVPEGAPPAYQEEHFNHA